MSVTKFPRERVLKAADAKITTVTVSLQAMIVGPKQVTMSVFRQLVEEPIFDWDAMALKGVGWGWVNYKIEEKPDTAIHLVWQRGDTLRRCIVERRAPRPYRDQLAATRSWCEDIYEDLSSFLTPAGERLDDEDEDETPRRRRRRFNSHILDSIEVELRDPHITTIWGQKRPRGVGPIKEFEVLRDDLRDLEHSYRYYDDDDDRQQPTVEQRKALLHKIRGWYCTRVAEPYCVLVDECEAGYRSYEEIVAPLFDLTQLFIAV
jgi:hypothetical protein